MPLMTLRNDLRHICWDGCGFSPSDMAKPATWNNILSGMLEVERALVEAGLPDSELPKLHNATWPGIVGRGTDEDPFIDFDTMLDWTAAAEVEGRKFDGVDVFLAGHIDLDWDHDQIAQAAEKVSSRGLVIGDLVAPVWPEAGGGSAMDPGEGRQAFLNQVRGACEVGKVLRELGVREYGRIRIDSATTPEEFFDGNPEANFDAIVATFKQACHLAAGYDEDLVAEHEICWGGMQSTRWTSRLHERVDAPNFFAQVDLAHTLLFMAGYNSADPDDNLLPEGVELQDSTPEQRMATWQRIVNALGARMGSFHVAQNDGSVKKPSESGDHGYTGKHCLIDDPNGLVDISAVSPLWLLEEA